METQNTYKAFYKGQTIEVTAPTSYKAQLTAAAHFKAKKSYEVTVMLLQVGGTDYLHNPSSL